MIARLRYALLLAAALLAIDVGRWPSVLTLGALVAVPLAAVGLVGVAAPRLVARRRWLRRAAAWGGACLALEFVAIAAWLAWALRRPVVPPPVPTPPTGLRAGLTRP